MVSNNVILNGVKDLPDKKFFIFVQNDKNMIDMIINFISGFPPQLATFFLSMLPVTELRGSLPLAYFQFNLPIAQAYFFSVLGNLTPAVFFLLLASPFHRWVSEKSGFLAKKWIKQLARAQKKFEGDYQKWGLIALAIFVAIPLPMTGAWTGSMAAFVFGIPFKKSFPMIALGVIISGFIVSLLTLGIKGLF